MIYRQLLRKQPRHTLTRWLPLVGEDFARTDLYLTLNMSRVPVLA
jgi:hypothetical protein